MKKFEKIYQELRKKYTDEEIAESMLIPADLTEEEQKKANEEMREFRFKLLREQTQEQRLYSDLLRLKFQIEDYLKNEDYTPSKSFGAVLNEYVRILGKTKKQLSLELNVHYTRMSRLFNDKEQANVELTYRLEKHSGKLISAILWWKLIIKKQEFDIRKDKETREREWSKVESVIALRA